MEIPPGDEMRAAADVSAAVTRAAELASAARHAAPDRTDLKRGRSAPACRARIARCVRRADDSPTTANGRAPAGGYHPRTSGIGFTRMVSTLPKNHKYSPAATGGSG